MSERTCCGGDTGALLKSAPVSTPARSADDRSPIRICIVNDYELVVAGLGAVLEPYADRIEVVDMATASVPDVPGVDVAVYDAFAAPDGHLRPVRELLANPAVAKVVAYSFVTDERLVRDFLAEGAHGFVSKSLPTKKLVDALERVHAGEQVVATDETDPTAQEVPAAAADLEDSTLGWPGRQHGLSMREAEVVALIAQGLSNDQIAARCYLSINTVKSYVRAAYRKMDVTTRAQAVAWAIDHGLRPDRLQETGSDE